MVHQHSLLVITINGAGLFIETVYLLLFLIYSNHKQRIKVLLIMLAEIVFVGVLSALVLTVAEIVFVGVLQQQSSMAAQPKKTLYNFTVMVSTFSLNNPNFNFQFCFIFLVCL
ncbi:putative SWEET sugar transporter [Helianthus annuus]|nr:putative SWEET sugar transporter [Helianthus annuus]